jgi:hypothetical protein
MFDSVNLQSGPTPRGRVDSAARIDVDRVLRSTSASTLFMIAIVVKVIVEMDFQCPSSGWTWSFGKMPPNPQCQVRRSTGPLLYQNPSEITPIEETVTLSDMEGK